MSKLDSKSLKLNIAEVFIFLCTCHTYICSYSNIYFLPLCCLQNSSEIEGTPIPQAQHFVGGINPFTGEPFGPPPPPHTSDRRQRSRETSYWASTVRTLTRGMHNFSLSTQTQEAAPQNRHFEIDLI